MAKPKTLPYEAAPEEGAYSVDLANTEAGADKVYKVTVEPAGDLWVVNYANGRRGGTLATGTKTKTPLPYDQARKIANGVLFDKVGGGYVPTGGSRFEGGMTPVAIATIAKESVGRLPQLANAVDEDDLPRLIADRRYAAQEKHDGERRLLIVSNGNALGGNRRGQSVALSRSISDAAVAMGDVVLDGEQCGDVFHAFDLLERLGEPMEKMPLVERLELLEAILPSSGPIRFSPVAYSPAEKTDLIERVRAGRGEGVVFKLLDEAYAPGRPASGGPWRKHKFWNSLSAIVSRTNDQRSVALELVDGDVRVPVGNVTIPANHAVPEAGQVVEIRYLYAYDGGSLYQPTYLGARTDIEPSECLASQRNFRADLQTDATSPAPIVQEPPRPSL